MEVDEAPQEEDVGKAQKPCEFSEEEGETVEMGKTPTPPPSVTELGEHPPEISHSDDGETSGEEGELSMSEEDSPQREIPASPVAMTVVERNSESGTHSEFHSSDQLPEDHREGPEAGAESDSEYATPSSEDNRLTNCSTIQSVDKDVLSDRTLEDKPHLAKHNLGESEDHITSENTDRNVDDNIDLFTSGDNDSVYHDKKCTKTPVNSVERISRDVRNENENVVAKNEKQRVSKTSLHDEPVELDYEEEGIEDSESLANTGGDDSKELEMGELDEKEEGEHSDDSGEISDDKELDDGEVVEDDDCEEGEIKDTSGRRPFTRYVCRFYLRGHCTWGPNCRFVHPGVNDKGNYSMMDQPYMQGPPGRGAHRGLMSRGHPGPWIEMPAEPDLPPPPEDPPTETAWERGLRQAKELRMKASKRKEMEVDFEEKRMHLTLEEEKDHNKENEERTRSVVNKDPPYYEPYELDEYYDKEVQDSWRLGQYENFEVRWNREPAEYPVAYNRGPEKERMVDKRRNREMMRYSPARRIEKRKEKVEKHDWIRRSDKPEQHSAPAKARVDEWQDPWQRTKSPKRKRSSTRSRSRGRPRAQRSNSRGSFSSSYSSSSFSSRSRSSSSYSSYSSRSSASRSSSFSSRSSSRSKSRSPRRHNWKQSGTMLKGGASSKANDAAPKSTVSRLGHLTNQGAAAGTLGAAIAAERKKAAQPPVSSTSSRSQPPSMRGQPSGGMRGQPPGMRGQPPGMRAQPPGGMRGQPAGNMRSQPPDHASSRTQNSASSRAQPPAHAPSRVQASTNSRAQPPSTRAPPSGHTTARPQHSAASRGQPSGVATLRTAPVKGPSPLPLAAVAERSRKPHRHSAVSPRERGRRSGSSSDSSRSLSVSRSSSASSIDSSSSASSGSADSEHLYRDIGSPAGSKQTVSPKKKVDKMKRDAADEKKEPRVKAKDSEKKSDKAPSGNTAGRKELYNSGRTDTKAAPPGKSVSTKGAAKNSSKQQAKVPSSSSTSASASEKPSSKSAASLAVRMQVKSTSLLKQPARMPERSDSKNKLKVAPMKQDEKTTASRNSDEKVSSSTKSVPRTAPALQVASVPATMSVQPAKTKDLLKVAGQKSSIKLTLISKSEKAGSRKRPAPDSDVMPTASPVKRPAKPPVHGVTKENTVRHLEKTAAKPISPKGKAAVSHRQAATSTMKSTANASGGASAPKKSMSSRREELLKQLKAVEDAIARKRAKMN